MWLTKIEENETFTKTETLKKRKKLIRSNFVMPVQPRGFKGLAFRDKKCFSYQITALFKVISSRERSIMFSIEWAGRV